MKTIKELAQMCDCSKTTINRLIKQLNITTVQDKNRLLVSDEEAEKLQQHVVNGVMNNAPNATQNAPNERKPLQKSQQMQQKTKHNKAENATNRNTTQHIETENATFNTNRNTTENADIISIYCETIEILKEQLKQKDKQIQSLQEENKLLIQSSAFALKRLEEKSEAEAIQEQDIKVYVEKSKEAPPPQEVVKKKKKSILSWFK